MRGQAGSETRRPKLIQKVISGVAPVFLTVCGHVHGLVVAGSVEIVAWLIIFEQTSTAARGPKEAKCGVSAHVCDPIEV